MSKYINLNELSITTQALLKKINEQAELKVDKDEVSSLSSNGDLIASIGDVDIYNGVNTSSFVLSDSLSAVAFGGRYQDLLNRPVFYFTCSSEASSSTKELAYVGYYNVPDLNALRAAGTRILIRFSNGNTAAGGTGISLLFNNNKIGTLTTGGAESGDGTYLRVPPMGFLEIICPSDNSQNTMYYPLGLSESSEKLVHIGTCNTQASSSDNANVVTCDQLPQTGNISSYSYFLVKYKYASNGNTYLQVNNGTRHPFANDIGKTWQAGDVVGYYYSYSTSQYHCWLHNTTKTSQLTNDSGYQTASQVNTLIGNAIGNINQFNVAIVQTLPTTNIDAHTIYFVPQQNAQTSNSYEEWMYINSQWEMIGTTSIDLSGYIQQFLVTLTYDDQNDVWSSDKTYAQISTALANGYDVLLYDGSSGSYYPYHSTSSAYSDRFIAHNFYNIGNDYNGSSISQHGYWIGNGYIGVIDITYDPDIPTATSDLTNDSGFITSADIPVTDVQNEAGDSLVSSGVATIPNPVFLVTISGSGTEADPYVSDKSVTEINEAFSSGRVCMAYVSTSASSFKYMLTSISSTTARFSEFYVNKPLSNIDENRAIMARGIIINSSGVSLYTASHYVTNSLPPTYPLNGQLPVGRTSGDHVQWLPYTVPTSAGSAGQILKLNSAASGLEWSALPTVPTNISAFTNDANYATQSYVDSAIPTVPTNVSSFTNDAGYLTLADLPIYDGTVI